MAQLVARLHGMQKVRGSNPLSSTLHLRGRLSLRRGASFPVMTRDAHSADLTVRELAAWAAWQGEHVQTNHHDAAAGRTALVLAHAVKLAEEVGELQAEVLGRAGYQRPHKTYTEESLADELADVMICIAILADAHGVDLGRALADKMAKVDARPQPEPHGSRG